MRFLHAMIRVKDIKRSLCFYENLMKMSLVKTKKLDDCELYFLEDEEHFSQIELTYNKKRPRDGYDNGDAFGHFAFSVESIEDFTDVMNRYSYEYLYKPYRISPTTRVAFLKDPDGNQIEIIEKKAKE